MRKFWMILLAMLAILALAGAACGGDDDDNNNDGGATRTATTSATDSGDDDDDDDAGPTETENSGGDDDGDSSGNLGFDLCDLLTTDEVSAVLGEDVSDGESQDYDPFFDCSWNSASFDSVSLSLSDRNVGEALYNFENDDYETVDNLGDEAQYSGGILPILEVLDGGYYFSISIYAADGGDEGARDGSIALARKVLDRLP